MGSVLKLSEPGFMGLGVAIGRSLLQKIERGRDREIAPTEDRGRDREIAPTEEGNLKFYLTFLFKCCTIKVASWSEDKPTPS